LDFGCASGSFALTPQPSLQQTRRSARLDGGLLIAYGHLVSGDPVLGECPRRWDRGIPVASGYEF